MKNWHHTRLRLLDGDSKDWITGPDILTESPYKAACESLKSAAHDNPRKWLTDPVEVEAAQEHPTLPIWDRFTLRARQTITIHDAAI